MLGAHAILLVLSCRGLFQCYQSDKPETRTASASITVTLLDINDHLPIFEPTTYNVSLVENSIGYVTMVTATDLDQVLVYIENNIKYVRLTIRGSPTNRVDTEGSTPTKGS